MEAACRLVRRDGAVRHLQASLHAVRESARSRKLWIEGIARDMTASRSLEKALYRAVREKELILDSLAELLFYVDIRHASAR